MKTIELLKKRMWYSYKESKKFYTTIYPFFKPNLPPEDDDIAKIWCNGLAWQFHVDFKYLIGLALAIWESTKPTSYFEGNATLNSWSYQKFWHPLVWKSQWLMTWDLSNNFCICPGNKISIISSPEVSHFQWRFVNTCSTLFSSDFWILLTFGLFDDVARGPFQSS